MRVIKYWFEKVIRYFIGKPKADTVNRQRIVINGRNDSVRTASTKDVPRITIGEIHIRTSTAAGIPNSEVNVEKAYIGKGIIVNKRHKPRICPDCRTSGSIAENPLKNPKWICTVCGNKFN